MHKICFIVSVLVSLASCQKVSIGPCPTQAVVPTFNSTAFLGDWYENRKFFNLKDMFGRCTKTTFSEASNGLFDVLVSTATIFGPKTRNGQAKLANPSSTEGKLTLSFQGSMPFSNPTGITDPNFHVLDTDYTTYTIGWHCKNVAAIFNLQSLWIHTRERTPPQAVVDNAIQTIRNRGLKVDGLMTTDQNNCS